MAVDERRVHGRADRQLEEEGDDRDGQDRDAGDHGPPPEDHAPVGREHEEPDGRRQQQGQRVVGHGDAVDERRRPRASDRRGRRSPGPSLWRRWSQVEQQHEQDRPPGPVEHVRVGVGGEPPEELAAGQQRDPIARAISRRPVQDLDDGRPSPATADGRQDRLEQVHPVGGIAERLQDDRGQPAEDHVARIAGRMGGAHDRTDRLELGRVPGHDAGRERRDDEQERQGSRHGRRRDGRERSLLGQTAERRSPASQAFTSQASLPTSCPRS